MGTRQMPLGTVNIHGIKFVLLVHRILDWFELEGTLKLGEEVHVREANQC